MTLPAPATPGTRLTLTVDYHGKPKDGLILTTDKDGKPSAVGDNWPNRVHHWIPTFDHPSAKATVTFNITAPAREEVVANGRLDHVETTANGQRTWTYSEGVPIPPYCMIIAVGQFARVEPTQLAVTPLSYYVPQSEKAPGAERIRTNDSVAGVLHSNYRSLSIREARDDRRRDCLRRHGKLERDRLHAAIC